MTANEIIEVILFISNNTKGEYKVEIIPESEKSNPSISFFHRLDDVNVTLITIKQLLDNNKIIYGYNQFKCNGVTLCIIIRN